MIVTGLVAVMLALHAEDEHPDCSYASISHPVALLLRTIDCRHSHLCIDSPQVYLNVSAETAAGYAKKGLKTGSYLAAVRSRYLFQTWVHHFGNAQMRKKVELVSGRKGGEMYL